MVKEEDEEDEEEEEKVVGENGWKMRWRRQRKRGKM